MGTNAKRLPCIQTSREAQSAVFFLGHCCINLHDPAGILVIEKIFCIGQIRKQQLSFRMEIPGNFIRSVSSVLQRLYRLCSYILLQFHMHSIRKQCINILFQAVIIVKFHLRYRDSSILRSPCHGKVYLYPFCLKRLGIIKFVIYLTVYTLLLRKLTIYCRYFSLFIPVSCFCIAICILLFFIRDYHQPVHLIALVKGNDR